MLGGVRLPLKNGASQNVGVTEIIDYVEGFETQNSVRIKLRAELTEVRGKRDMQWTAEAYERSIESGGQLPLAYASLRCSEKRLVRMEDVVLSLLYALDFQLAKRELEFKEPKMT